MHNRCLYSLDSLNSATYLKFVPTDNFTQPVACLALTFPPICFYQQSSPCTAHSLRLHNCVQCSIGTACKKRSKSSCRALPLIFSLQMPHWQRNFHLLSGPEVRLYFPLSQNNCDKGNLIWRIGWFCSFNMLCSRCSSLSFLEHCTWHLL